MVTQELLLLTRSSVSRIWQENGKSSLHDSSSLHSVHYWTKACVNRMTVKVASVYARLLIRVTMNIRCRNNYVYGGHP